MNGSQRQTYLMFWAVKEVLIRSIEKWLHRTNPAQLLTGSTVSLLPCSEVTSAVEAALKEIHQGKERSFLSSLDTLL